MGCEVALIGVPALVTKSRNSGVFMRLFKHLIASLSLLTLAGCPAPPDSGGQAGGNQPGGPGPEGVNPPINQGEPGQNPEIVNRDAGGKEVTDTAGIPTFTALIDSGVETINVSGKVPGVAKGQLDIQIAHKANNWTVPKVVHQVKVVNESFSFKSPKEYQVPLYLTVIKDTDGDGKPGPADEMIYYAESVVFGVDDVELEIVAGDKPAWVDEVFSNLPDPESGGNVIKDGPPPGAASLDDLANPKPDGVEDYPPGDMPLPKPNKSEEPGEGEPPPPPPPANQGQ